MITHFGWESTTKTDGRMDRQTDRQENYLTPQLTETKQLSINFYFLFFVFLLKCWPS